RHQSPALESSGASQIPQIARALLDGCSPIAAGSPKFRLSGFRRHVTRSDVGAGSEKMPLPLLGGVFSGGRIGEQKPILVHEHRLMLEPLLPSLFRDVLVDTLAEFTRIWREVESLGLAAELDAVNHACHRSTLQRSR